VHARADALERERLEQRVAVVDEDREEVVYVGFGRARARRIEDGRGEPLAVQRSCTATSRVPFVQP
jgi:hypothetical protein